MKNWILRNTWKTNLLLLIKKIELLKKLSNYLPRHSFVTLYKAFIWRHLDYVDILYDKPNNMNICDKIESLQYNASLAITAAIRRSSKRWLRKLCLFYKTVLNKSPNYLYNYVLTINQPYQTRSGDKFLYMYCRTEYLANFFFPYTLKERNNLSPEICKSVSYEVFKNSLLKFVRPSPNSLFNVSDSLGIRLLTRLRLGLSHIREHKFNHNFQDTINPLRSCSLEWASTTHFFLHCQNFTDLRKCLMNQRIKIDSCNPTLDEKFFTKLLLYGDGRYDSKTNESITLASINFINSSKRFDGQLMWLRKHYICLRCLDFSVCLIKSMNQIMRSRISVSLY